MAQASSRRWRVTTERSRRDRDKTTEGGSRKKTREEGDENRVRRGNLGRRRVLKTAQESSCRWISHDRGRREGLRLRLSQG